ncbi:EAL domain-containing protein [Methylobacterium organophilum]|uniref:putative bifunctional diguanylate cyclase/phosphodiesterase n=1 Tax=Methylobacterium organophilum TaxID=410 RepID=UPI001F1342A0|nr:EAL domain-containing protein [Methylobacterium organophilum]UMY19761.1 EAL domain-containing protein [Methylobacterium organophilum]
MMLLSLLIDTDGGGRPRDGSLDRRVRIEQVDVALRLAPFTVLVSLSVVQVVTWLFWSPATALYLGGLDAVTIGFSVVAIDQCRRWRTRPKPEALSRFYLLGVYGLSLAFGILLASIPVMLFVDSDPQERLLIACTCAGLIACGMSAAVLPGAAIGYSGPIVLGSYLALGLTRDVFYAYVAVLLTFYASFIFATILHFSRLVRMRVEVQVDLERQQELTSLLLNDFEENASDWLWETDANLRLQHVSARFAEVSGFPAYALQDLSLERLFARAGSAPGAAQIWDCIADRHAFRAVMLPMEIGGRSRWWEVSGKPIFDRRGIFTGYRGVGSDITERKLSENRLSHLATHDSLTELPNRVLFQERLDTALDALGADGRLAVLCLDLDEFKAVNDAFGHGAGDALLQGVANRLRVVSGSGALVARLAGDEFAMLVEGRIARDRHATGALAAQVVDALAMPFFLDGIRVSIGVSIGIAVAPEDGKQDIMRKADLALYRAKSEGRKAHRFYEAEMDEVIEARRALTADLRGALERHEFVLYFQPLVSAESGRIQGFEALVRWRHPARGFVSPAEFIPLAEETGVVIPLGEWIIREACRIAAAWGSPLSVAVNLSAVQFRHSDLAGIVREALRESGLPAERLELEVTESVFLAATPAVHEVLRALRGLGLRLSLDDFGTGYSSLSYLRRVAFDKIKIDRSFVNDLPDDASDIAIVRAIIDLASALGMTVTAEGVETEAQRDCLMRQGCRQFQGYLFGRPMPAAEAAALAARGGLTDRKPYAA